MGLIDKVKDFVSPVDVDDDEYEELPEEKPTSTKTTRYEQPSNRSMKNVASGGAVSIFEPRSFVEAEDIGRKLKDGSSVVVNLHRLPREFSQRTIDFLTGVVFALDGKIQKIGHNTIFCAPHNVDVEGEISSIGGEDAE